MSPVARKKVTLRLEAAIGWSKDHAPKVAFAINESPELPVLAVKNKTAKAEVKLQVDTQQQKQYEAISRIIDLAAEITWRLINQGIDPKTTKALTDAVLYPRQGKEIFSEIDRKALRLTSFAGFTDLETYYLAGAAQRVVWQVYCSWQEEA
jgi:hypothetical protein